MFGDSLWEWQLFELATSLNSNKHCVFTNCNPWLAIWNIWFLIITSFLKLSVQTEIWFLSTTPFHGIHYPSCIRKTGPLIHMWCLKFEGNHNFFNKSVKHFKNITKSAGKETSESVGFSFWEFLFLNNYSSAPLLTFWSAFYQAVRRWMKLLMHLVMFPQQQGLDVCMFWCWKFYAFVQQDYQDN